MSVHWGGRGPGHVSRWPVAAVRGFTPADLGADLLANWDAEVASSLTLAGSNVTTWADTKNGYVATQGVSGSKPAYSATSLNNRPGLTHDGADDYLEVASQPFPSGANPCEIWVLCSQTALAADTTTRIMASYGGSASTIRRAAERRVISGVNRAAGVVFSAVASNGNVVFEGIHLIRVMVGATEASCVVDGVSPGAPTAAVPNTGTERFRIGAISNTSPGNYFQGVINSILITLPLSTDKAAALTSYLKARGGIA